MPISKAIKLGCVVTSAGQINQVQSHSLDPGIETLCLSGDGRVDYEFATVMFMSPILRFTSTALGRALTAAGVSGLAVTTSIDFWLQKASQGGTRLSGTNSIKVAATTGLLVPTQITAVDRQIATISYEMAAVSPDGSAAPILMTVDQTMPALTAVDEAFTVGPVSINGDAVEGVRRITYDTGLRVAVLGGSGEGYPTFAYVDKRKPTISVETTHVDIVNDFGGFHVAQDILTDSAVYFRRKLRNGVNVPAATTEHIKLGIDDGLITCRPISSEDEGESTVELLIEPTFDGTADVVAVSTAAAIA